MLARETTIIWFWGFVETNTEIGRGSRLPDYQQVGRPRADAVTTLDKVRDAEFESIELGQPNLQPTQSSVKCGKKEKRKKKVGWT